MSMINKEAERHHPDYSKPLKVEFLCIKCHKIIHQTLKND